MSERPFYQNPYPCPSCGAVFGGHNTRQKQRKFCSRKCSNAYQCKNTTKKCVKCHEKHLVEDFPRHRGVRARSCKQCFRPRTPDCQRQGPVNLGKQACKYCKRTIRRRLPPSQIARLMYCSSACRGKDARPKLRTCLYCRKSQPREQFLHEDAPRGRSNVCASCARGREDLKATGIGYLFPVKCAIHMAKRQAGHQKVPLDMTDEQFQHVYGSPCTFCGGRGCVFRRGFPELGFIDGNVSAVCWVCAKWSQVSEAGMAADDVVRHARAISAYCAD